MSDPKEKIIYRDINELTYSPVVVRFLRSKLDNFMIDCFREVKNNHNSGGLIKTALPNYVSLRKKYDTAFVALEYQGFIESKSDGVKKPFFLTPRGFQLVAYLAEEKQNQ